ncbi:MAG: SAM-dependent methyltransferase [Pirellulales bacterium]
MSADRFAFVVCQQGAEKVLKAEFARILPTWKFGFSRPGFVTFKVPADFAAADDWSPKSVFARTWGWTLGKIRAEGDDPAALVAQVAATVRAAAPDATFHQLHVWPRDAAVIGRRGYEPGPTDAGQAAESALCAALPGDMLKSDAQGKSPDTRAGQHVLDVVLVEPNEWWIGRHTIRRGEPWSRWPGGIYVCDVPETVVSRAYIKMREALASFRPPFDRNEHVVEIGSSPGGASQALLKAGFRVIGVDPAEMHEKVLAEKHFEHWRMRGNEIRKTRLRGVKWLTADLNVAPEYTLDTVEEIVTNQNVRMNGLILTIKLQDWDLAAGIPEHLTRVRDWGYRTVRARQLSRNRQEYCLYAYRTKLEDARS